MTASDRRQAGTPETAVKLPRLGSLGKRSGRRMSAIVGLATACLTSPTGPAVAGVSFPGGFETGLTSSKLDWGHAERAAADRLQRVTSVTRKGKYALRVEVRPGDQAVNDAGRILPTGETAQLLILLDSKGQRIDENERSGTKYFAFSVRLDTAWKSPGPDVTGRGSWSIIWELHGPVGPPYTGVSPAFAFYARDRFSVAVNGGNIDDRQNLRNYELSNSLLNAGNWVDFVVKITFAATSAGEVVVWRRDEGQADFGQVLSIATPTLHYKTSTGVLDHYWKAGLYRGKQPQGGVTSVLWLDGFTRADTFEEAKREAFP